jgi:hypothetical protein
VKEKLKEDDLLHLQQWKDEKMEVAGVGVEQKQNEIIDQSDQ